MLDSTVTLDEARRLGLERTVSKRQNWLESVKLYRDAAVGRLTIFNDEPTGFT